MTERSFPYIWNGSNPYLIEGINDQSQASNDLPLAIPEGTCLSISHHNCPAPSSNTNVFQGEGAVGPLSTDSNHDLNALPENEAKYSSSNGLPQLYPASPPPLRDENKDNVPLQHIWRQTGDISTVKSLHHLVVHLSIDSVTTFLCGWNGCTYPVGFSQKAQLITHIRSVHLQEKPFQCTTCGTSFSRKQEAIRHVNSMNNGKTYKCSFCDRLFVRRHTRDNHEDNCAMCEMGQSSLIEDFK